MALVATDQGGAFRPGSADSLSPSRSAGRHPAPAKTPLVFGDFTASPRERLEKNVRSRVLARGMHSLLQRSVPAGRSPNRDSPIVFQAFSFSKRFFEQGHDHEDCLLDRSFTDADRRAAVHAARRAVPVDRFTRLTSRFSSSGTEKVSTATIRREYGDDVVSSPATSRRPTRFQSLAPHFEPPSFRPETCAMDFHGNLSASLSALRGEGDFRDVGLREIVIVDPRIERYEDLIQAARDGRVGLHICVDGRSALRLARTFQADAWLVAASLPDMSGFDLVEMLGPDVAKVAGGSNKLSGGSSGSSSARPVNRLRHASRPVSGDRLSRAGLSVAKPTSRRTGMFLVADTYRVEDEQRALVAGVSGYVVGPVTAEGMLATRRPLTAAVA